jgi:phytoene dehydrogenase-like protein
MPHPEPTTILPFLSSLCDALSALFARFASLDSLLPTSLLDLEHHLAALLRSFQDQLVHLVLTFWLSHTSLLSDTSRAYKAAFPNASHKQNREVSLTFLG